MSEHPILLVKHRIPYPVEIGSDAVSFALLRVLQAEFPLTVVSIDDGERSLHGAEYLRGLGVDVILERRAGTSKDATLAGSIVRNARLVFMGESRLLQSQTAASLPSCLDELTRRRTFALAQFENWATARYRPFVHCPAALLNHDAWFRTVEAFARYERAPLQKLFWRLETRAVRRYELAAQDRFEWRLFLSEEDRRELIPERDPPFSAVLPVPFPFEPADASSLDSHRTAPIVLFVGAMNVRFNVDAVCYFVERIWPEVRRAVPEASFIIAGRLPSDRVRRLAREPGVRVDGEPDLGRLLRESQVAVSPARMGTGIKVKVAQAMSAGLPVVGTPQGLSGLAHADCLLRATDAPTFAEHVVRLLRDQPYREQIGRACHTFYREQLWMEAARPKVIALYRHMIEQLEQPIPARVAAPPALRGAV
jgi:glycosyltransferase involved in cell wall biosynthesis